MDPPGSDTLVTVSFLALIVKISPLKGILTVSQYYNYKSSFSKIVVCWRLVGVKYGLSVSPKDSQHYQLVLQCARTERWWNLWKVMPNGKIIWLLRAPVEGSHADLVGLDRSPQEWVTSESILPVLSPSSMPLSRVTRSSLKLNRCSWNTSTVREETCLH